MNRRSSVFSALSLRFLLASTPLAIAALAVTPKIAVAQSKTAAEFFKDGNDQYTLGNFVQAAEAFKKAFELETDDAKKSSYIYNIAQSYRLAKDCEKALFFYKRFVALRSASGAKPLKPSLKAEIDGRIAELEVCAKEQAAVRVTTPNPATGQDTKVGAGDGTTPDPGKTEPEEKTPPIPDVPKEPSIESPHRIVGRLGVGAGKSSIGNESSVKVGLSVAASGGYVVALAPFAIEVGAGVGFSPLSFADTEGDSASANLISVHGYSAANFEVANNISIRAQLELGALLLSGLKADNPFTIDGGTTTGALTVFQAGLSVGASYQLSRTLSLWVAPHLSIALPPTGFEENIKMLRRLDGLAGVGLHL
jgi:tetratricopeptide (TPR) repeat protein